MTAATTSQTPGAEFREDARNRRRPLPPETLARLTVLDPVKATAAVLQTVLILIACVWIATTWWTPWAVIPAILVIAARQQACFVLAHEAAHYRLYRSKWLNNLIGRSLATIVGISMFTYRVIHRLHHNNLYSRGDPDMALVAGYPRGRSYLLRKLARDLAGLTAPKTYSYFFGAPAINTQAGNANRPLDDTAPSLRAAARRDRWVVAGFHIIAPLVAFTSGYGIEYLLLWVLPAVTVLQAILRFRAICEHGASTDVSSPLTAARTNFCPWWLTWYLFPHNVNYHIEHHLYPAIPQYNLAACHRALNELGVLEGAEVRQIAQTTRMILADPPPHVQTAAPA